MNTSTSRRFRPGGPADRTNDVSDHMHGGTGLGVVRLPGPSGSHHDLLPRDASPAREPHAMAAARQRGHKSWDRSGRGNLSLPSPSSVAMERPVTSGASYECADRQRLAGDDVA